MSSVTSKPFVQAVEKFVEDLRPLPRTKPFSETVLGFTLGKREDEIVYETETRSCSRGHWRDSFLESLSYLPMPKDPALGTPYRFEKNLLTAARRSGYGEIMARLCLEIMKSKGFPHMHPLVVEVEQMNVRDNKSIRRLSVILVLVLSGEAQNKLTLESLQMLRILDDDLDSMGVWDPDSWETNEDREIISRTKLHKLMDGTKQRDGKWPTRYEKKINSS